MAARTSGSSGRPQIRGGGKIVETMTAAASETIRPRNTSMDAARQRILRAISATGAVAAW
jgi:hypothetical protein